MKKALSIMIFLLLVSHICAQSNPIQGYSYSKLPLTVMGFTKTSTMAQVKKQLENWGIKWNVSNASKNVIQIRGVRYEGCLFTVINFAFDSNGKLLGIDFIPENSENYNKIHDCFSSITKNYPYRNTYSVYYTYITREYYVFNGYDDTEFAIWDDSLPEFGFCFNGSISDRYGIYP